MHTASISPRTKHALVCSSMRTLSNEYDIAFLHLYSPDSADYGKVLRVPGDTGGEGTYPIQANTEYVLKVEIKGSTFACSINNVQLFSGTDETYGAGKVGIRARRSIALFDDFKVTGT